jgi:hypothetical protein
MRDDTLKCLDFQSITQQGVDRITRGHIHSVYSFFNTTFV